MRALKCFLSGLVLCTALTGCTSQSGDESMYLTGTEESAITGQNGQPTCTNPKKVLICHIPPGNPANEHSICVGAPAVAPHQQHHGDTIGACGGGGTPPQDPPAPDGPDAGVGGGGGEDAGVIL